MYAVVLILFISLIMVVSIGYILWLAYEYNKTSLFKPSTWWQIKTGAEFGIGLFGFLTSISEIIVVAGSFFIVYSTLDTTDINSVVFAAEWALYVLIGQLISSIPSAIITLAWRKSRLGYIFTPRQYL